MKTYLKLPDALDKIYVEDTENGCNVGHEYGTKYNDAIAPVITMIINHHPYIDVFSATYCLGVSEAVTNILESVDNNEE